MENVRLANVAVQVLWSEPTKDLPYVFQRLKIGRISEYGELPDLEAMYKSLREEPPRGVPEEGGRFVMTGVTKPGFAGSPLHEVIVTVYISRDNVKRLGMLPGKVLDMDLSLEVTRDSQIRPTVVNTEKVESTTLVTWFDELPKPSKAIPINPLTPPVIPLSAIPNIKDYILDVIFNGPAVTVKWTDGTKTTVKAQKGEKIDPEKGFAMAVVKKVFGNNREYYHTVLHWLKKSKNAQ